MFISYFTGWSRFKNRLSLEGNPIWSECFKTRIIQQSEMLSAHAEI